MGKITNSKSKSARELELGVSSWLNQDEKIDFNLLVSDHRSKITLAQLQNGSSSREAAVALLQFLLSLTRQRVVALALKLPRDYKTQQVLTIINATPLLILNEIKTVEALQRIVDESPLPAIKPLSNRSGFPTPPPFSSASVAVMPPADKAIANQLKALEEKGNLNYKFDRKDLASVKNVRGGPEPFHVALAGFVDSPVMAPKVCSMIEAMRSGQTLKPESPEAAFAPLGF